MNINWAMGIFALAALYFAFEAVKCSLDPSACQDIFMTKQGFSRSIVAKMLFPGQPEIARQSVIENPKIRTWFLVELYGRSIVFAIIVLFVLIRG